MDVPAALQDAEDRHRRPVGRDVERENAQTITEPSLGNSYAGNIEAFFIHESSMA